MTGKDMRTTLARSLLISAAIVGVGGVEVAIVSSAGVVATILAATPPLMALSGMLAIKR